MRGGRRRFLYTSTRFGAGTCSCAATGYSAISFTEPGAGSCANTDTDAIAQPDACSSAGASTNSYAKPGTSAHRQRGISREFRCRRDERSIRL